MAQHNNLKKEMAITLGRLKDINRYLKLRLNFLKGDKRLK